MSVLSDGSIRLNLGRLIEEPERDLSLVNPASLDFRIGRSFKLETGPNTWAERDDFKPADPDCDHRIWTREHWPVDSCLNCLGESLLVQPGDFLLASTLETINVPNGYAVHVMLKSTIARQGWNHALAGWTDPGWSGVLTLEIKNWRRYTPLRLVCGQKFGQLVFLKMTEPAQHPYRGRYQGATQVEAAKA